MEPRVVDARALMPAHDSTSWTLIQGAAASREVDRDEFCRRYAPVIRAYLAARWKLPYEHDAVSDATQDVFVQCFKEGGALEGVDRTHSGGFRAYLYGVVRNVALMTERKYARRRERPAGSTFRLDHVEHSEATLSQAYDRAWALLVTREAGLRMVQRASQKKDGTLRARVLEHRYEHGKPPREIATELGADVGDVYRMLKHSRQEFRISLLEVMSSYHPDDSEAELERRCAELLGLL